MAFSQVGLYTPSLGVAILVSVMQTTTGHQPIPSSSMRHRRCLFLLAIQMAVSCVFCPAIEDCKTWATRASSIPPCCLTGKQEQHMSCHMKIWIASILSQLHGFNSIWTKVAMVLGMILPLHRFRVSRVLVTISDPPPKDQTHVDAKQNVPKQKRLSQSHLAHPTSKSTYIRDVECIFVFIYRINI